MTGFPHEVATRWRARRAMADGAPLRLADTPAYALARTVEMPDGHPYPHGALSFRLSRLTLSGLDIVAARGDDEGLHLRWERLRLEGCYALEAKPDPVVDLDVAGNLMDLPPEACRPAFGGGDDADGSIDPQTEQWLDEARYQRTKLMGNANGQQLMGVYNTHSETYAAVFANSPTLPSLWRAGGATKAMAADTSTALGQDGHINDPAKTYVGDLTYNANAFVQQLNVAASCVWIDPYFSPNSGPPPGSKYWEAARAALSFGMAVEGTGNSKDQVTPLTGSQVHAAVDGHGGTLAAVTDDQMGDLVAMGAGVGGAPLDGDLGWIRLDEDDLKRLRHIYQATMRKKAEDAAIVGIPVHAGPCHADIGPVTAEVRPARPGAEPEVCIALPAFALDIDDADWDGEVGRVARRRLESMYFIRSLLRDEIEAGLRQAVAVGTAEVLAARQPPR